MTNHIIMMFHLTDENGEKVMVNPFAINWIGKCDVFNSTLDTYEEGSQIAMQHGTYVRVRQTRSEIEDMFKSLNN